MPTQTLSCPDGASAHVYKLFRTLIAIKFLCFCTLVVLCLLARRSLAGDRNGTEWKEQSCHSC